MRRPALAAGLAVVLAAGWMAVLPSAPIVQPIAFNHRAHVPMACRACHTGVERGASALLPGPGACAKCHATAPRGIDAARWQQMQQSGTTAWVRVTDTPDHVLFSHRRHVVLGRLECESCHRDIGRRTSPPPRAPARLDMDACVSCHRREAASDDCAACHR